MSDVTNESVLDIGARLDAVDVALDRLRDGSYRSCELCDQPINDDILAAEPLRTNCAAHPTLSD